MTATLIQVLEARASAAEYFRPTLTPAERQRAARYQLAADRDRYVVSAGLLRQAAGMDVGRWCQRCGRLGDHGQPVPLDAAGQPVAGMALSATHSAETILVAVSTPSPVGIDVEALALTRAWSDADRQAFDRIALSARERESLAPLSPAEADRSRLRAWVRKEAVLKATGLGLAVAPSALEFDQTTLIGWPAALDSFCSGGVTVTDLAPQAEGVIAALAVLSADDSGVD
jgi:4'-phosphopantetheinyl transferase